MMKVVQIGILIALIVVGVLLFGVWRGQRQQPAPIVTAEQTLPPPAAPDTADVAPAPSLNPAPKVVERRPSPSRAPVQRQAAETPAPAASTPPPAPAPPPAAVQSPPVSSEAPPASVASEKPLPPPPPRKVTMTAGTLLSVRLGETLRSDQVEPGDTFTATLDRPLVVDNMVIAEKGARLEGKIVEAQRAGKVKGVSSLAIHLVRLHTSDGQNVPIETETFRKQGETSKREDAAKVGAGAGIGAAIGAIAGGGKGAAIGAAIGGAAGGGTVLATRGKPTVLPSETRIDFRLTSPVTLTERTH